MPRKPTAKSLQAHLRSLANDDLAKLALRFFKTDQGDYGEGDEFLGIRVPVLRAEVRGYFDLSLVEVGKVLQSRFHEERLFALLIMVYQFSKSDALGRKTLYEFYLKNTRYINNWDLVDCSAYKIIGPYLEDKDRKPLYRLAESECLWERRIAIISTLHLIKNADFFDALQISEILLQDKEDLIHKAVGWMLREIGKKDRGAEELFLKHHHRSMPRTMLRYAIEHFPKNRRQAYLTARL